jgi:putative CocE/NonD family hydrolase
MKRARVLRCGVAAHKEDDERHERCRGREHKGAVPASVAPSVPEGPCAAHGPTLPPRPLFTKAVLEEAAAMLLLALALVSASPLVPFEVKTDEDFVRALKEHYTKREHMIPMRDGVKLYTHVWTPKRTPADPARTWPIILVRTPYGIAPYGVENVPDAKDPRVLGRMLPSREMLRLGYIIAQQDVRGRMMSEGTFVDVRPMRAVSSEKIDESTDAWDTIDWLVKSVERNNGRVGLWGISYPGFYAAQGAVDAHPALKAVSPQAPVTDWFIGDDFHHNGALCVADAFGFYGGFGKPRKKPTKTWSWEMDNPIEVADIYDFFLRAGPVKELDPKHFDGKIPFWRELLTHPNRDAWWQARDPLPRYRDIKPATMVVGGWYDAEDLWGALHTYAAMEQQTKANRVSLVLGPWSHGGWHRSDGDVHGDISFGQKTSLHYREHIETPFWESHLRGDGKSAQDFRLPEASVFVTGSNEWRAFHVWPPKAAAQTLYFSAHGALTTSVPMSIGSDAFLSDPNRPVPYMGGASEELDHDYMTADQRFASRRPDVLTYETGVLVDDVTLAGPIVANVHFETTGTDADIVVKLIDVWPEDTRDPDPNPKKIRMGGYQQLVRAEAMRGRFRNSFEKPAAFSPGTPSLVKVALPDVAHTFRTGHRIAVQVQSSWFPMIDRNPQTFVDIATASEAAFQRATHTVHRSAARPSSISVGVLEGKLP